MSFTAYRYYKQRRFQPNQIANCFEMIISQLSLASDRFSIGGEYRIDDNIEESKVLTVVALKSICEIEKHPERLNFHFADPGEEYGRSNIIVFQPVRGVLQVGLNLSSSEKFEIIFKTIEECLQLERTELAENKDSAILAIEERLHTLEKKLVENKKQLSCFLSYRFNSRSKALALELSRFLELLGVTVITGAGYEPRRVDQKVITRLEQPLDFLIYLITADGESIWTRDELAFSLAKGYALVLLVESGTKIEKGLLGDWEYLEFEGNHIGDSFVGILEALHFIEREKIADQLHNKNN